MDFTAVRLEQFYGSGVKQDHPPSLGFAVLLAARVRLFEELIEVFLPIRGARGSMGVLVMVFVAAVVVAVARHRDESAVTERRGEVEESVGGPTMLLKVMSAESSVHRGWCCVLCAVASFSVDNAS